MINAEITKSGGESTLSTIRKFSRRVQGTGLVRTVRGNRYFSRKVSKIVKKKRALKLIKRREEYRKLLKEGKIAEAPVRTLHSGRMGMRAGSPRIPTMQSTQAGSTDSVKNSA